ncbi:MAG: DUF6194 family protein [Chloroflexota bacterium]
MTTFSDVDVVRSPGRQLDALPATSRSEALAQLATLGTDDDIYDTSSDLARPGVYRLNIGVGRASFDAIAAAQPTPDHTAPDVLMPHPVYAAQRWVCVVCPSASTWEGRVKALLDEAHGIVARRRPPVG